MHTNTCKVPLCLLTKLVVLLNRLVVIYTQVTTRIWKSRSIVFTKVFNKTPIGTILHLRISERIFSISYHILRV